MSFTTKVAFDHIRNTAAGFTAANPVVGYGVIAYETDTYRAKLGDGVTAYNSLTYFSGSTEWSALLNKPASFTPSQHASSHGTGGSDAVQLAVAQVTGLQAELDGKAALGSFATLNSPAFTGTPTVPSPASGNSSQQIPTTAFVGTADAAVQAYAIQRSNHTGTQSAGTITGLGAVATSNNYSDLTGKPTIPSEYTLPVATASVLGGVKQGSNTTISGDGTISVAAPVTSLPYASITGTPTLGTAAPLDVAVTGDATSGQVVLGNDTRLSDSRTPSSTLSHASTHASGGSDAISIAASQMTSGTVATARLATGTADSTTYLRGDQTWAAVSGGSTDASSLTSGTLSDSRLSSNVVLGDNYLASVGAVTAIETVPRHVVNSTVTTTANLFQIYLFTPVKTTTVTGITVCSGNAGSGITTGRLGLFTWNESTSTATCVAKCANSTSLLSASGTMYRRDFDTAGGFPSAYTLQAGTRYGLGLLVTASTTQPTIAACAANSTLAQQSPRLNGYKTGSTGTDFAASYASVTAFFTANVWAKFS